LEEPILEELNERVEELEQLVWSLFRALETYITVRDLRTELLDEENSSE